MDQLQKEAVEAVELPQAPEVEATEAVEEPAAVVEQQEQATPEEVVAVVSAVAAVVEAKEAAEAVEKEVAEVEQTEKLPTDPAALLEVLASDIQQMPLSQLKTRIEEIKVLFYKLIRAEDDTARARFVAAGGAADDYTPETTPAEARFKELLAIYRTRRDEATQASEEQKAANYAAKLGLIEELKALVDSTETMGQTFDKFRDIQARWKEIGIVPIAHTKDLWETYHHHTENFYNFVKINKELRDIDLKKNYEAKLALCETAEELNNLPSAVAAFNELQKLHDAYREAGPVAVEYKEALWERFKAASARINKRHQEHFDALRAAQEQNLAMKEELCAKAEECAAMPLTSVSEWNAVQEQIAELQKVWKTIGFAPKKDNNKIYERFRAACDKFFAAKRAFFAGLKGEMDDNLQVKEELCVQAEALSESEDWKATTDALIELQRKWKESGPVARRHSEAVWRRFRTACDKFFERKDAHFKESDGQYAENLAAKEAILAELEALEASEALTFDLLKETMGRYTAVGFVPIKQKDRLAKAYKAVCDRLFDRLRGSEGAQRMERLRGRIDEAKASGRGGTERDKLTAKLRGLQGEISTLENNIGFFAHSKNAGSLVEGVQRKIAQLKEQEAEIKQAIKQLS